MPRLDSAPSRSSCWARSPFARNLREPDQRLTHDLLTPPDILDALGELLASRGYLEIVAAIESGELTRLWELRAGAPPPDDLLPGVLSRLHALFR